MKLSLNHYEIKLQNHFYLNLFLLYRRIHFFLLILSLERQLILAYNENKMSFTFLL